MGAHRSEHSVVAAAPVGACFDLVADIEAYPDWTSSVRAVTVHERDEHGRACLAEFEADAKIRTVRYTLRYHFDPHSRIWWDYVSGEAQSVEGECLFEPAGDGTRLTYRLAIDPGRFIPGPLKRVITEHAVEGWMRDVARRVGQA